MHNSEYSEIFLGLTNNDDTWNGFNYTSFYQLCIGCNNITKDYVKYNKTPLCGICKNNKIYLNVPYKEK